jgi:hypothetical protein
MTARALLILAILAISGTAAVPVTSGAADAQTQAAELLRRPQRPTASHTSGNARAFIPSVAMDAQARAAALLRGDRGNGPLTTCVTVESQSVGDAQAQAAALLTGSRSKVPAGNLSQALP